MRPCLFKLTTLVTSFLLLLASCKKDTDIGLPENPEPPKDSSYQVVENFEQGKKAAYAIANVDLKTGSWSFDDALIGNTTADTKDSLWSVRLRNGNITTNFKITGLKKIFIATATYGNDGSSTWQLQTSSDGQTFSMVGQPVTVNSKVFRIDSFDIPGNTPIQIRIVKTGSTRINIDNIIFKGASNNSGIIDTTGNGGDTTIVNPPASGRYVTVGPDAPPATGDNSNLLFGNPSNADSVLTMAENFLINQHYYIQSYSKTRATPNWVSWHIDASNITGAADRQDDFAAWAGLQNGWFVVQSSSYMGSGYDRGHNVPSADRTSSVNANSSTFLMTNMIPQAPQNNQQTWNNFEQYIRTQVSGGQEAYVIMGSYGNAGTIANGNIVIPSNVWKVVVLLNNGNDDLGRVAENTRVIAINTPNTNTVNADWKQYRVSVDQIEQLTGYDLLSKLPVSIQNVIEAKVDNQ